MRIIANGVTRIQELEECMELIASAFTTDRSTEDRVIEYSGDYALYKIKIGVFYDEVQSIEIEVL